jgi:hypothetical protein
MITLGGRNILLGGFHEHWYRIDTDNTAYLLSALNYYNFDFVTLMDGYTASSAFIKQAEGLTEKIKLYAGFEYGCAWGHVVAVGFKNNCDEEQLIADVTGITDVDGVFARLRESYDMLILAHPDYEITWHKLFMTGEIDRLLDEGIIDAVNIINSGGFNYKRHRELIKWYQRRETEGKATPIAGGWDAHLLINKLSYPDILYTREFPPKGHIDTAGVNRSLVFDAQNDLASIVKAVKECRVVIEDIETGEFVGPAELISCLENHQYHSELKHIEDERSMIKVSKNKRWFLNKPAEICFNQNGTVCYPLAKDIIERKKVTAGTAVQLNSVDVGLTRDEVGIPVVFNNSDGFEAVYSVRASHQICIDVLPGIKKKQQYIEVRFIVPFEGRITINCQLLDSIQERAVTKDETSALFEVAPCGTEPVEYTLNAVASSGVKRTFNGVINFYQVKQFLGSWDNIPCIEIDKECFYPAERGYGSTQPWVGAELFSGSVQTAWTPQALHLRFDITDAIHDQPLEGHFIYDADCVQIAIDPLCLRRDYRGHFYNYNLALTNSGPELFQMFTPDLDQNDNPLNIEEDRSLGAEYLTVEKTERGLIYDLVLPWELVGREVPGIGDRMGVYIILANSNGNGVINSLKWPVVIPGLWMIPKQWGVFMFTE